MNHHLLRDLVELGLWDEDMKSELILNNGSVQVSWITSRIQGWVRSYNLRSRDHEILDLSDHDLRSNKSQKLGTVVM